MANALLVAWRSEALQKGWQPIGRLEHEDGVYRFCYTKGAKLNNFRPFTNMSDLEQVYESEELFPVFANRLLPKNRPEYEAYLRWGGFDPDNPPDPISILAVTEGRRETDSIEVFPCPLPDSSGCYINKFFAHGVRRLEPNELAVIHNLKQGQELTLEAEMDNEADPLAVAIYYPDINGTRIGYIPRYLAGDVWNLYENCHPDFIHVYVERVNKDAPLQQRLLCRMTACWPENFTPCSGELFEPIPQGVRVRCKA